MQEGRVQADEKRGDPSCMNATMNNQQQSEPWPVHRSTIENLDPITKIMAEGMIKAGKWQLIEG